DAERDAVEARDDAPVEAGRARVDGDRVALGGIADPGHALIEEVAQDAAPRVRRAADEEVLRRLAPVLLEPLDVALEAAGSRHDRGGPHRLREALAAQHRLRDP